MVCVLGHVDTGKTKLLDKIRRSNVQANEPGGITQQIGATNFPAAAILKATQRFRARHPKMSVKIPGLLIIDTPGHECFSNLRQRGSSICDIAVLVVDITAGIEQQTVECLNMLLGQRCPFIIALNKIDRIYDWKLHQNAGFEESYSEQTESVKAQLDSDLKKTIAEFACHGVNTCLHTENSNVHEYASLVPISALTGEGIPDLLACVTKMAQRHLTERITIQDELSATILEVEKTDGLGTTLDVILANGELRVGDEIIACGLHEPVHTKIRALVTPQPLKELRVQSAYMSHRSVQGAIGVRIAASNLDTVVPGTSLQLVQPGDDVSALLEHAQQELNQTLEEDNRQERGLRVHASSIGSLHALLSFLRQTGIAYSSVGIGAVHKRDVLTASTQLCHGKEHSVVLAFDVAVDPQADKFAHESGVEILASNIVYHLADAYQRYSEEIKAGVLADAADLAIFPCQLRILSDRHVFNQRSPVILGVRVEAGQARIGTPVCVPSREGIMLGRIASMQRNHQEVETAQTGDEIACKIETGPGEQEYYYGRHFGVEDDLVSKISRESIDVLKEHFRDQMRPQDWKLVIQLKSLFRIL